MSHTWIKVWAVCNTLAFVLATSTKFDPKIWEDLEERSTINIIINFHDSINSEDCPKSSDEELEAEDESRRAIEWREQQSLKIQSRVLDHLNDLQRNFRPSMEVRPLLQMNTIIVSNVDADAIHTLDSSRDNFPEIEFISAERYLHIDNQPPGPNSVISTTVPCSAHTNCGLETIRARNVSGFGGKEVIIAVLDTGIHHDHCDFEDGKVIHMYDAIKNYNGTAEDGHGHGTHVASTTAGNKFGVALCASIVAIKVCDDTGSCPDSAIMAGLNHVLTLPKCVHVISMSFGGPPDPHEILKKDFEKFRKMYLCRTSCLGSPKMVAAAGNELIALCNSSYSEPAIFPNVISVAAVDCNKCSTLFSVIGNSCNGPTNPDIAAPGKGIIAAATNTPCECISCDGTSMAAPHVSGAIALLLCLSLPVNTTCAFEHVEECLYEGATPVNPVNPSILCCHSCGERETHCAFGHGVLDVPRAHQCLKEKCPSN